MVVLAAARLLLLHRVVLDVDGLRRGISCAATASLGGVVYASYASGSRQILRLLPGAWTSAGRSSSILALFIFALLIDLQVDALQPGGQLLLVFALLRRHCHLANFLDEAHPRLLVHHHQAVAMAEIVLRQALSRRGRGGGSVDHRYLIAGCICRLAADSAAIAHHLHLLLRMLLFGLFSCGRGGAAQRVIVVAVLALGRAGVRRAQVGRLLVGRAQKRVGVIEVEVLDLEKALDLRRDVAHEVELELLFADEHAA